MKRVTIQLPESDELMMSNGQDESYEHIRALVRDLHITRNVARPEHLDSSSGNHHRSHSAAVSMQPVATCENVSLAQKLIVHQLCPSVNGPRRATIDSTDLYIEEEDETSDTNTSSLDISPMTSTSMQCTKRTQNGHYSAKGSNTFDGNLSIPSVVITDVNEPVDLITSTQRRFSQLYSGLRRFSTSHTVGIWQKSNQTYTYWPHLDQQHAIELCVWSDRCT